MKYTLWSLTGQMLTERAGELEGTLKPGDLEHPCAFLMEDNGTGGVTVHTLGPGFELKLKAENVVPDAKTPEKPKRGW